VRHTCFELIDFDRKNSCLIISMSFEKCHGLMKQNNSFTLFVLYTHPFERSCERQNKIDLKNTVN
jgi:hypothetical protein